MTESFRSPRDSHPAAAYERILDSLGSILWEADARTFQFTFVSRRAEDVLGYPRAAWLEPGFWQAHTHPDDVAWATAYCVDSTASGRDHQFEYRMLAADGRVVWMRDVVSVVRDPDGAKRLRGIMLDVTDRARAKEYFRTLVEHAWDNVAVLTPDAVIRYISPAVERMLGHAPAEIEGRRGLRFVHRRDQPAARRFLRDVFAQGRAELAYRARHADGSWRHLETVGRRIVDPSGNDVAVLNTRDVTERVRAEAALRESEALYRFLAENTGDIITLYDAGGRRVYVSPAARRLLGHLPDAAFGGVHPEDLPAARAAWARILAGERTVVTYRHAHADGSWRWLEAWGSLAHWRGAPHVMAVTRDVTARREAEEGLRRSEARYRSLSTASAQIVWTMDAEGGALVDAAAWREFTGRRADEARDAGWLDAIHPEDRERVAEAWRVALRSRALYAAEYRLRRRDGAYRHVASRAAPVLDGGGRTREWVGATTDVTEHRAVEEQLLQAQKMEAVGRLAGGVAHDFNNLLTVILGYCDLLLGADALDAEQRRDAGEIRRAAERAALLTQQLLAFSRKQVLRPAVLDLNAVVEETSRMLRRLIGEDVELVLRLAPDAGPVRLDAGQLQQVVLNLAVNARDAMPTGGRLTVETGAAVVAREVPAQPAPLAPGRYARLAVVDSGVGMSPAVLARAFEPFFTTKEPGKGTGLGLSTVYGIVTQSGGRLRVASAPGRGTTFELFFPVAESPVAGAAPAAATPAARGPGTILLVEDEPMVRHLAEQALARAGYRVLAASGAAEALRVATAHEGAIDMVVTDVVMPGLPGPALVARLEAARPGVRVLYVSGYAGDTITRHGVREDRVAFLGKPFTADELTRRVREVLDG